MLILELLPFTLQRINSVKLIYSNDINKLIINLHKLFFVFFLYYISIELENHNHSIKILLGEDWDDFCSLY